MAKLKYGKGNYYIEYLAAFDEKELRQEYARLREVALKRLAAFSRSKFSSSRIYLSNLGRYDRPASAIQSREELIRALADVGTFVGSEAGSVRGLQGIRKRSIQRLHENGFDFVTAANYDAWIEFIDWYKEHESDKFYPTPEAMREMVKEVQKGKDPQSVYRQFQTWKDQSSSPWARKAPGHLGMRDPSR